MSILTQALSIDYRGLPAALVLCLAVSAGCGSPAPAPPDSQAPSPRQGASSQEPFFDARVKQVEYVGPGREEPPPADAERVILGWFGPDDPDHPLGGSMWQAASMAIAEANERGGHGGLDFELLSTWSENPWGTGIKGVTELAYKDGAWGLLGAPNSAAAHLVEQVVAKARVAFVSPVATDKTTNLVNVPWIYSCAPEDTLVAQVLAEALTRTKGGQGFVVISGTDHGSRQLTTELFAELSRRGAHARFHLKVRPEEPALAVVVERVLSSEHSAAVVLAPPSESARIVKALRAAGFKSPLFGGPHMGRRAFLDAAKASRGRFGNLQFPALWSPQSSGPKAQAFAKRFYRLYGVDPDYAAAYTYDATHLLVAAVRKAGLNRVNIRDAIQDLQPFEGVTGTIRWLPTGRRMGAGSVRLQRVP